MQDTGIDQFTDLVGLSLNDLRTLNVPEGAVGPLFFAVKKEAEALWTGTEACQSLRQSLSCAEVEFVRTDLPSSSDGVQPKMFLPSSRDTTRESWVEGVRG